MSMRFCGSKTENTTYSQCSWLQTTKHTRKVCRTKAQGKATGYKACNTGLLHQSLNGKASPLPKCASTGISSEGGGQRFHAAHNVPTRNGCKQRDAFAKGCRHRGINRDAKRDSSKRYKRGEQKGIQDGMQAKGRVQGGSD
eukprot:1146473-Pelagomonas_calceolata.AAC.7